jgi:hypothetical protein
VFGRSLSKLEGQVARYQAATKRAREKAGEVTEQALQAAETVGTAFGFGVFEGRLQNPADFELAGVPIPLLLGVGAHAAAFLGVGRNMEPHLHAIGNGALAAHLNGLGRKMGSEMKTKAGSPKISGVDVSGALPPAGVRQGTGITEADLAALT